jgi:tetratricopeptide (TPR) repeat protein
MAVSYVDEGNMDRAMEELEKSYAVAEGIHDASAMSADLITMGDCLFESGSLEDALAKYESARDLIMASDLSQEIKGNAKQTYLFNTARIDAKKQDFAAAHKKADTYLKEATTKHNLDQIRLAHELAAMIALEEQNFDKALIELGQASQLNPYNHYRMALAYEGKGHRQLARECCKKAAEFNALNNIDYAFIRNKACKRLATM